MKSLIKQKGVGFMDIYLILGMAVILMGGWAFVYNSPQTNFSILETSRNFEQVLDNINKDQETATKMDSHDIHYGQENSELLDAYQKTDFLLINDNDSVPEGYQMVTRIDNDSVVGEISTNVNDPLGFQIFLFAGVLFFLIKLNSGGKR
jgi:hypothetical protein